MNLLPHNLSIQRGYETEEHKSGKVEVIGGFQLAGFEITLGEHHYCDVLARKLGGESPHVVAGEYERSPRNLLRNIRRDFAHGAEAILVVSPDAAVLAALARKVSRHLPPDQMARVGLMTLNVLRILRRSPPNSCAPKTPTTNPKECLS